MVQLLILNFLCCAFWKGVDYGDKSGFGTIKVAIENGLQVFSFKQLYSATAGFSKSNVVGQGGFGLVYRGVLNDGRKVAVKVMDQAGKQGEEEFQMEVCSLYTLDTFLSQEEINKTKIKDEAQILYLWIVAMR